MNERLLQFRVGLFAIVAGLVLTMLVVWFEAPALLRERRYVTAYFVEAPGIDRGIPVRKSGVHVGEVYDYTFTEPDQPDGVLVTLALDPKYAIRAGSVPKLSRAIIGDVAIDFIPGPELSQDLITTYADPQRAMGSDHWVEGMVATDPFVLINDAARIFDQADETLVAIELAAEGLAELTAKLDEEELRTFVETWTRTGESIDQVANEVGRVLAENEAEIKPTITRLRSVAEKFDELLDDPTQDQIKESLEHLADSAERLDRLIAALEPIAADLAGGPERLPQTNLGQVLLRANRISYDVAVFTSHLTNGQGGLNRDGTIQKLVSDPKLHDELIDLVNSTDATVSEARAVLRNLAVFADKISRNPSLIGEGVLNPR